MGIRYTVRRGDSLWSLAGRYLGDFTRYRDICDYHNEQAQRYGWAAGTSLIAITDPNRIYVGQLLLIPGRGERPAATGPKGTKADAGARATPIELKVEYTIGAAGPGARAESGATKGGHAPGNFAVPLDLKAEQRPGAPIRYGPYTTPDYTMTGELSGKIALENMNPDRHRGNWQLAISENENVLSRKLKDQYEQAFLELTADMGMKFDPATGVATVRPRIAAKAGLGPYSVKVEADSPTHFTSTIDLKPIEGSLDLAGRKFKYSSKLSVKLDITLHPTPKGRPGSARETTSQKVPKVILPENPTKTSEDGLKIFGIVTVIVVVVVVLIVTEGGAMIMRIGESMKPMGIQRCPALRSPLWLTIDPKNSGQIA
jgi:hypothetical protein